MKRIPLLLIAGAVSGALVFGTGAASTEPSHDASDIEQLRKDVAALRQRIESLEKRLDDSVIVIPKGDGKQSPPLVNPPMWPHQIPRTWKPFEFNGMPFYVIPIDNSSTPVNPAPQ